MVLGSLFRRFYWKSVEKLKFIVCAPLSGWKPHSQQELVESRERNRMQVWNLGFRMRLATRTRQEAQQQKSSRPEWKRAYRFCITESKLEL